MGNFDSTSAISVRSKRRVLPLKWASVRLLIQAYVIFCFVTVIRGALTFPLDTSLFLGDFRFWRYFTLAPRLYFLLLRSAYLIARGGTGGLLFSVPLTVPPTTEPDLNLVKLSPAWPHGKSCGTCTQCCDVIKCPIVDVENGRCIGYNSVYWRYFNCGRFPATEKRLVFYGCPKWQMR